MRSEEELRKMKNAISEQLETLPDTDAFGGSNIEEKESMQHTIRRLDHALSGNAMLFDKNSETDIWILGEWSTLEDYLL